MRVPSAAFRVDQQGLDNPVWQALIGAHAGLASGDGLARRYRRGVTPIGAVREPSPAAYAALAALLAPVEILYLGVLEPAPLPAGLALEAEKPMLQMQLTQPVETATLAADPSPVELGAADAGEMCALVDLTHPGPFGPEAYRLGRFIGLRDASGRLVAMAGERFRVPGCTEISAVCTHPDVQGRGYARLLMNHIAAGIQARGETPFLHVLEENTRAAGLYLHMGFTTRRRLWARIVRRVG